MGSLGDGIVSETGAGAREMRTTPLWGLHRLSRKRLLHDGRAHSFHEAIEAHDGQAAASRDAFQRLEPARQAELIAFLNTL